MNSKGHDQTVQVIGSFTVGRFASLRNLQGQNKGSDKIEWIHRLAEPSPITDILSSLVFFWHSFMYHEKSTGTKQRLWQDWMDSQASWAFANRRYIKLSCWFFWHSFCKICIGQAWFYVWFCFWVKNWDMSYSNICYYLNVFINYIFTLHKRESVL